MPMGSVLENPIKPTYMPALNRAGFYKYFFLVMLQDPESLEKMLAAFCTDTYRPAILNQPDVQRRDRTLLPELAAQAAAIQNAATSSVCQEMAALVQGTHTQQNTGAAQTQPSVGTPQGQPDGGMTHEERMWKIHVKNSSLVGGDVDSSNAAYRGRPNYV
jgi:hypothetical protein